MPMANELRGLKSEGQVRVEANLGKSPIHPFPKLGRPDLTHPTIRNLRAIFFVRK